MYRSSVSGWGGYHRYAIIDPSLPLDVGHAGHQDDDGIRDQALVNIADGAI